MKLMYFDCQYFRNFAITRANNYSYNLSFAKKVSCELKYRISTKLNVEFKNNFWDNTSQPHLMLYIQILLNLSNHASIKLHFNN